MNDNYTLEYLEDTCRRHRAFEQLRNQLIVKAREEGIPIRTIAQSAGVSHMTILNIVKRQETQP